MNQLTQAQINRRKKAQAHISIAGGTMGLTALALRGKGAAHGTGKIGALARRAGVKADPKKYEKFKDYSTGVTTAAGALGGAGAFNFASYTRAEAKKRQPQALPAPRRPRTVASKSYGGMDMMDFGLGSVHQGEREIVEKAQQPQKPQQAQGYKPMTGMVKPMQMPKPAAAGAGMGMAARQMKPLAKPGAGMVQKPMAKPMAAKPTGGVQKPMAAPSSSKVLSKRDTSWMNIEEHERRGRDARRAHERSKTVRNVGLGVGTAGLIAAHAKYGRMSHGFSEAGHVATNLGRAAKMSTKNKQPKMGGTYAKNTVKGNAIGATVLGGTAAYTGGTIGMSTSRGNERRHDLAISQLRKKNARRTTASKSMDEIFKKAPYDPERNRQRRFQTIESGLTVAAGGAGAGAVHQGLRAAQHGANEWRALKTTQRPTKTRTKATPTTAAAAPKPTAPKGKKVAPTTPAAPKAAPKARKTTPGFAPISEGARKAHAYGHVVEGRKALGRATLFGAGAVAAGMGAQKVRQYKRGRGRSYSPLRLTAD